MHPCTICNQSPFLVSRQNGASGIISRQKTGVCRPEPRLFELGKDGRVNWDGRRTVSCASVAEDDHIGKHIQCRCNELLNVLLKHEKDSVQIETMIPFQSFTKYCLCYLGASARAGFEFVQMTQYVNPKPECIDKKPIRKGNPFQPLYISVCDAYETNTCGNGSIKITHILSEKIIENKANYETSETNAISNTLYLIPS